MLHVDRPFDRLDLQPAATSIELGASQGYIAYGVADGADPVDVTTQTVFTIKELNGSCVGASCTATEPGDYTVIGTLTRDGRRTVGGTAKLRVLPRQPSISSVTPASTLPGRSVEVRGNTGSCNRAGTLTFHGMTEDVSTDVTADENGNFVARFTVPRGTFPRAYKLELTVDCNRQLQWVQSELTVINLAPVAVDDSATTTQDTPVAIAVAANDRNPDPDTGYQTVVVEHRAAYQRAAYHYEPELRAFGGRHPGFPGDAHRGCRRSRAAHHGEGRPRPRAVPAQRPAGWVPPRPCRPSRVGREHLCATIGAQRRQARGQHRGARDDRGPVAVEPNRDSTQTFTVRLEPHHDPGTQTVQEVTG